MTKDPRARTEPTPEEVVRLSDEAKARGEPATPILRRFVLLTIDGVIRELEAERQVD